MLSTVAAAREPVQWFIPICHYAAGFHIFGRVSRLDLPRLAALYRLIKRKLASPKMFRGCGVWY